MTGFLPFWAAVTGLSVASTTALVAIVGGFRIPPWLLALAAALAIGTYR